MITHRDGHGSELVCSEPECPVGGHNRNRPRSVRLHSNMTVKTFWAIYTDMRR
jgi:hypothetical protein